MQNLLFSRKCDESPDLFKSSLLIEETNSLSSSASPNLGEDALKDPEDVSFSMQIQGVLTMPLRLLRPSSVAIIGLL